MKNNMIDENDRVSLLDRWYLAISESDFDNIYFGLGVDKDIFKRMPETDIDYVDNFAVSKLWRMNNWYKVINKDGDLVWFVMNRAQHVAFADQIRHSRVIILKSRQRRHINVLHGELL
jgi:hypothetical protein